MNIIYRLVNRKKEKNGEFPCYYIGSKMNYVPGAYWGSSRHPILIEELKTNISNFEIEILEHVDDPKELTLREREYQLKHNVLIDPEYYNLQLANEKFTSMGRKWYYDPVTLIKGYFQDNKIPTGWVKGCKPKENLTDGWKQVKQCNKTGLKKTDPKLRKHLSDTIADTEWILRSPEGKLYTVTKLHKFCEEHNLSQKLRLIKKFGVPIKKGKSKGWCVIDKKR